MKTWFPRLELEILVLVGGLACFVSISFAGDDGGPLGLNGYYSGTPLGAAAADPYGQNHYYVPGYALSPGLRAFQNGAAAPIYGQPYTPGERLDAPRRPADRPQPPRNENAKPDDDINQ